MLLHLLVCYFTTTFTTMLLHLLVCYFTTTFTTTLIFYYLCDYFATLLLIWLICYSIYYFATFVATLLLPSTTLLLFWLHRIWNWMKTRKSEWKSFIRFGSAQPADAMIPHLNFGAAVIGITNTPIGIPWLSIGIFLVPFRYVFFLFIIPAPPGHESIAYWFRTGRWFAYVGRFFQQNETSSSFLSMLLWYFNWKGIWISCFFFHLFLLLNRITCKCKLK